MEPWQNIVLVIFITIMVIPLLIALYLGYQEYKKFRSNIIKEDNEVRRDRQIEQTLKDQGYMLFQLQILSSKSSEFELAEQFLQRVEADYKKADWNHSGLICGSHPEYLVSRPLPALWVKASECNALCLAFKQYKENIDTINQKSDETKANEYLKRLQA